MSTRLQPFNLCRCSVCLQKRHGRFTCRSAWWRVVCNSCEPGKVEGESQVGWKELQIQSPCWTLAWEHREKSRKNIKQKTLKKRHMHMQDVQEDCHSLPTLQNDWASWIARLALLPHSSPQWHEEALGGSRDGWRIKVEFTKTKLTWLDKFKPLPYSPRMSFRKVRRAVCWAGIRDLLAALGAK